MREVYKNIVDSKIPLVMGILNVTPDSFSDGGKFNNYQAALNHAAQMIKDGVDIIDVGGESTRPGASVVNADEEIERVVPIIAGIVETFPNTIVSVDTRKSPVAEEAIKAGANIINDISAGSFDENILGVAQRYNAPYVLMHMKGTPENMQIKPHYVDVVPEIYEYFEERIDVAKKYGVHQIILDPGIGFGKRIEDNYEILNNLKEFLTLNYPLLVGVSKKSFLGKSLELEIDDRSNATTIAETISVLNGAKIIRTHNVMNAVQIKNMMFHLTRSELPANV